MPPSKTNAAAGGAGKDSTKPKPKDEAAKPVQPGAKEADKGKKARKASEIDDIFSIGKASQQGDKAGGTSTSGAEISAELKDVAERIKKARAEKAASSASQAPSKKPKIEGSKDDIFGDESGKARKRTEEGYAIYTEEELGLGKKGGDTDLCPFDCDCCF